ncbi:MAG: hypothetical protein Aureis2KO_06460 [Aureisphaera sp.]
MIRFFFGYKQLSQVYVLLVIGFTIIGMALPRNPLPIIEVDNTELSIGEFLIEFDEKTFKNENLEFTYDSIIGAETFQKAVEKYFPNLVFNEGKNYVQLQDTIHGWKFETLLADIGASQDSIDMQWRSLALKNALGSSLIAIAKKNSESHVFIEDGKLSSVEIGNDEYEIDKSNKGFIIRKEQSDNTSSSTTVDPEKEGFPWQWISLLLVVVIASVLGYLRMKKHYISVNQLKNYLESNNTPPPKALSENDKGYLAAIFQRLKFQQESKDGPNSNHESIVVGHRKLEGDILSATNLKEINGALLNYFKSNNGVLKKLGNLQTFLNKREELNDVTITVGNIDSHLSNFLTLLDENSNQKQQMFKNRLEELCKTEANMKGLLERSTVDSDSELLDILSNTLHKANTEKNAGQLAKLLKLFKIDDSLISQGEEILRDSKQIDKLLSFLKRPNLSEGQTPLSNIEEMHQLSESLQSIVPGNRFDFKAQSRSLIGDHLFNAFLTSIKERETSLLSEAKPQIINNIKLAYQQLTPENKLIREFDVESFISREISPYLDLLSQYERNFSQENRYLYQFHERFKGFSERLEQYEPLSQADKSWLFQQLFTMAFHILDYVKVTLSLPKTDGSDLNYNMILNNESLQQLNENQYQRMTKSAIETPMEVRKILELAHEVNIETLDEILFYGFYIGPDHLKDELNG